MAAAVDRVEESGAGERLLVGGQRPIVRPAFLLESTGAAEEENV
eukprot:SAG22_NODE_16967_length_314_cov_0.418605_1_plen_43_part_10